MRRPPGNPDFAWALTRLRERLGDGARRPRARKVHVARYPSGAPREIFQYLDASGGEPIPDGVWTAWHEGGELAASADFVDGVREGLEARWNPDGRRVTRGESPALR